MILWLKDALITILLGASIAAMKEKPKLNLYFLIFIVVLIIMGVEFLI